MTGINGSNCLTYSVVISKRKNPRFWTLLFILKTNDQENQKRIIEREPGAGKKIVKGFGGFLIIGGVITMLVGIPTGITMITIDGSEMAGVVVAMWLAFVPFWFGLLFGYLGRRPSQEVGN